MPAKKRNASMARKTAVRYVSAPRRRVYRKKSAATAIPAAAATIGMAAANLGPIQTIVNNMTVSGVKSAISAATTKEALIKTGIYTAGGYVAGEVVRRYAPSIIKTPMAKIAKKIPKVV